MRQDSDFALPGQTSAGAVISDSPDQMEPIRTPTDLVSPKTARVHSIGFHIVAGVDGGLMLAEEALPKAAPDDSCEAIVRSILGDHDSTADASAFELFVLCGGKQKRVAGSDKPLQVLKHFEDLELEPRPVLRRTVRSG